MIRWNIRWGLGLAFACCALPALALDPQEFVQGLALHAEEARPVQELVLPDAVYGGVMQASLTDLRVFNADNVAVPHALCASPSHLPAPAPVVGEAPLPVFELRSGADATTGADEVHVDIRGSVDADIHVDSTAGAQPAAEPQRAGYVAKALDLVLPIRALRLAWETADGASTVQVRVEASEDLDQWRTIVGDTTLLKIDSGGQTLERMRIELPLARYRYLRLMRTDDGPPPRIDRVLAETVETSAAAELPFWMFDTQALPPGSAQAGFSFDAARQAPVQIARIKLPSPNMTLRVTLQHRRAADAPWVNAWSGEVFAIDGPDGLRTNADPRFAPTRDRWWRVQVAQGGESLAGSTPQLQLGYRPQTLRFLAQGAGPYLLAFGSSRADPAPARGCNDLLEQMPAIERASLVGHAQTGAPQELGGAAMLEAPPAPTPVRLIVLWAVLIGGSVMLVAMALSVMRKLRH